MKVWDVITRCMPEKQCHDFLASWRWKKAGVCVLLCLPACAEMTRTWHLELCSWTSWWCSKTSNYAQQCSFQSPHFVISSPVRPVKLLFWNNFSIAKAFYSFIFALVWVCNPFFVCNFRILLSAFYIFIFFYIANRFDCASTQYCDSLNHRLVQWRTFYFSVCWWKAEWDRM